MSSRLAIGFLAVLLILAVAGDWISPGDPLAVVAAPLMPPLADRAVWLGTDVLGRSVAAGLIHGARLSVVIGFSAALASVGVGVLVGTAAGFAGGFWDALLMRLTDAVQTVPVFLLALAMVAVLGPAAGSVVLAIVISSWPGPARLVRAEILSLRERDFVAGCRALGMSPLRIALLQVMPNALGPVFALAGVMVAAAILVELALSFLGLGDPNHVSWGGMVASGRSAMREMPSLVLLPGGALAATVLAVNLASDAAARWLRLDETAS